MANPRAESIPVQAAVGRIVHLPGVISYQRIEPTEYGPRATA